SFGGQGPVLDGSHALAYGELQPRTAMRVSRRIGADAIGFLHRGANLFARVRAAGRHGPGRADAAGHEDLDVIRAAAEVFAGAATDVVHAVVARQRAAVAVVGGQPASGHEQPRARNHAGLDRVAHVHIEVLLAHDPHRGRAGREIAAQIARGRQRLWHRPAAELTELIALARDERGVAVAIDEPRHDEAV